MFAYLRMHRWISAILTACFISLSLSSAARAGIVGTSELVAEQELLVNQQSLIAALERPDVQQALIAQGVDPEQARLRVGRMTAEEVSMLNQRLDELPAGSGILELAVFIFLVLLVTDILGYTDIFPFVVKKK